MMRFKFSVRSYLSSILFLIQSQIFFAHPLSGTYTVGGDNPDFTAISNAVDSLISNGISSSVIFNIRSGVYLTNEGTERAFYISQAIQGASETNTITFKADESNGADYSNTIFRRISGGNEEGWVAYVNSSYITLENLSFQYANNDIAITGVNINASNVYFKPAVSSDGINNITVKNCRITASGASVPRWGISILSGGNNILLENNLIERCGDGIYIERCNGCLPFNNVSVLNNTIRKLYTYQDAQTSYQGKAIYISNGNNYNISGNDIDYENSYQGMVGVQVIGSDVKINGNLIRNTAYQIYPYDTFTGIYLRTTGGSSLISNNMISNIRKRGNGIYLENSSDISVYNNSVVLEMVNAGNIKLTALVLLNSNNIDIKNNILMTFFKTGGFNSNLILETFGSNTNITLDYNILYSEPFFISFNGTDFDSLSYWQQSGNGAHSKSLEPEFLDLSPYRDLHLGYCSLGDERLIGIPLQDITTDIDGEARDDQSPYIGADEVDSYRPNIFSDIAFTQVEDKALHFASGDLDNDNDDDIVVVNNFNSLGGSEDISIFLNDGEGNFSPPSHYSMGIEPTIIKIEDVDGDGFNDLIAATKNEPVIRWGQGGGNFSAPLSLPDPGQLGHVTDIAFISDPGNNPVKHLVQTHFGIVGVDSGWVSFLFHNNRSFYYSALANAQPVRAGMHPSGIVKTDLDNDGITDFVVNDWITNVTTTFINQSDDTTWQGYSVNQQIPVIAGTNPIHADFHEGDIDGDNDIDIVIGSWAEGTDSLAFLRNDGAGNFTLDFITIDPRRPSMSFSLFDYEGDGDEDIITATTSDDMVLYLNNGAGGFQILRLCQNSNYGFEAGTILKGNFNNDDYPDVAVLTYDDKIGTMLNLNFTVDAEVSKTQLNTSPNEYVLEQNYPNPFNPFTNIQYSTPVEGNVIIKVFNILGEEVKTLVNDYKKSGAHTIQFEAENLSSGIYFYKIQAGSFNQVKKMILLR